MDSIKVIAKIITDHFYGATEVHNYKLYEDNLRFVTKKLEEISGQIEPLVIKKNAVTFGCELGKNHCVTGTSNCLDQSVVEGYCKYYKPKKL